jgi:hypothetical protein
MAEAQIDLEYRPHPHQYEIHKELATHRFGVIVSHRRFGKTLLSIMSLIRGALGCTRDHPRFGYVAPRLKQAKQIAWMYLVDKCMRLPGAKKNEGELYLDLPNGARITLYGATEGNEEAMRGVYMDGVVIDEVAGLRPHVWGEIIRPALADRLSWSLFIGTPHGMDLFYELYQQALKDPSWFSGLYRVDETDLPWLPPEEIELAKRTMSDAAFRQEFLCDFSAAAENALITIDLVSAAAQKNHPERDFNYAPRVIGVDVARFGDDRSVIQRRQGLLAIDPIVFKDIDNMTLAGRVGEEVLKWKADACFVDAGRGEGVIDRLRQLGHSVVEVNFGGKPNDEHYQDKRTEMWMEMKHWLEQGGEIPNHPELKTDLCVPTYDFLASGKVRLESKDRIKERGMKSPDIGDALALTFAQRVHPMAAGPLQTTAEM